MITIRKSFVILGLCDYPKEIHVAESDLRSLRSAIDEVLDPPKSEDVQLPLLTIQEAAAHVQGLPSIEHPSGKPFPPPIRELRDGEPCSHFGCLQHVSHPCEGCGRIAGISHPVGVPLINVPPIVSEGEWVAPAAEEPEMVAGVPMWLAKKLAETYKRVKETQGHQAAMNRCQTQAKGHGAAKIREVLRAMDVDVPDPMTPEQKKAAMAAARARRQAKSDPPAREPEPAQIGSGEKAQAETDPPTPAEEHTVAEIIQEAQQIEAESREDKIEAKYKKLIADGMKPGAAISRLAQYFRSTTAKEFRELLRGRGYIIPEPAAPGRGKEPPATKKAAEIRKTPKVDPQENAHLVREPRRSHVPVPRPADRVPPPPSKPSTEPPRPAVAILGADHIETVQGIRMILQGRDAAEISREFRTDRITKTAIAVWMESNRDWLDWLQGQPPFKVNEILAQLQQDLKPIENRGGARPTVHKEAQL